MQAEVLRLTLTAKSPPYPEVEGRPVISGNTPGQSSGPYSRQTHAAQGFEGGRLQTLTETGSTLRSGDFRAETSPLMDPPGGFVLVFREKVAVNFLSAQGYKSQGCRYRRKL